MTRYFIAISALLIVPTLFMGACACERIYQGKVIDADTLLPLEGARVKASWWEYQGNFVVGDDSRLHLVKKTLTDHNGDWQIKGPEGFTSKNNLITIISLITRLYFPGRPSFSFKKDGYVEYGKLGCLRAYPVFYKDIEGIALDKSGNTLEERCNYYKRFSNTTPLIIIDNPERRLRDLDFSFRYPSDLKNISTISRYFHKGPFDVYTVIGLKKETGQDQETKENKE